jgi:hypothetical protein
MDRFEIMFFALRALLVPMIFLLSIAIILFHQTPPADAPVFKRGEEAGVSCGSGAEGSDRFRFPAVPKE